MRVSTDSSTLRWSKAFRSPLQSAIAFLKVLLVIAVFASASATVFAGQRFVPGQILIKAKAGLSETNLVGKLNRRGVNQRQALRHSNVRLASVSEEKIEAVLSALRKDPEIEFAERDYLAELTYVPNDPLIASGAEWYLGQIHATEAWDFTAGTTNTVIAVLDSGVTAQPELAGQLLSGYDFVNNDADTTDDFGHGTAVAGTIAAIGNNSSGIAGVAFGCRVLPVKVADSSGFASYSAIAQGIRYAVDQGARIINLSIAGSSSSATLQDAINYAWDHNVVIVASAGNNANNVPQYPAACDHVIAVSATAADDSLTPFSSYGSYVTLAAPGDNIWTTTRGGNVASWRGTSFSSPIVAAVAGLVVSENPSLSNAKIVSILEDSADDLGEVGRDDSYGFGRVNAYRAVVAASSEPGALPVNPPKNSTENPQPVVLSDTNAPSVSIVSAPKNNSRLMTPEVSLSGVANDDVTVTAIQLTINGATQTVSGTTNWNAQLPLSPGVNTIRVRSVDAAGNVSPEVVRTLTYVMLVPVTIFTNGIGKVTPGLDGKLLEVGKTYTIRAVPGAAQAFAGWTGIDSQAQTLSFTVQPGLQLTANFVVSPFPKVGGSYAGLLWNTNAVTPSSSGAFILTVTPSGSFSGKLTVAGTQSGFSGQFDLSGKSIVSVKRRNLPPLNLKLTVDLANGSDQVVGQLTDGAWVSALAGDRNVFNAKLNPASQAGMHNFVLEQSGNTAAASGSSTIGLSGATRVKGKLSDGRAFTAGSILAKNGDYPLYLSMNSGTETVIGWLNFPSSQGPAAGGTVLWIRTGTNAFAAQLQAASLP